MKQKARITLCDKLIPVFNPPRGGIRYRCAYGGRGSGKSYTFALMAAMMGYTENLRILCTRELHTSIKESFHAELKAVIAQTPWLANHYDVGIDYLRGKNGTEFIFRGLRHNMSGIKSMAQIDICIVEEAEDVPETAWVELEPTIRALKSEIWVVWNPKFKNSPVDIRFIQNIPPRTAIANVNWADNPWFPPVLNEQRLHHRKMMEYDQYMHIWEGRYWMQSDAQVLKGKVKIREFIPQKDWNGPYFGADWGFSVDPTTLIKMCVAGKKLYIEHEEYSVGVEIDHLPEMFDNIEGVRKYTIRADSARPETISYMKRQGFNIIGAVKGKGSVEDGVAHLRGYEEIIIHPRCVHTAEESMLWSYKKDRLTSEVMPALVDANNHCWDAIRYALEPIMKKGTNMPRTRVKGFRIF